MNALNPVAGASKPAGGARPQPAVGARPRRQPVRTCVACRTAGGKRGLLRVVRLPEVAEGTARVAVDLTGKQSGRGAYLCPTPECVATALKRKALERSLKVTITEDVAEALRATVATIVEDARRNEGAEGDTPPGT